MIYYIGIFSLCYILSLICMSVCIVHDYPKEWKDDVSVFVTFAPIFNTIFSIYYILRYTIVTLYKIFKNYL